MLRKENNIAHCSTMFVVHCTHALDALLPGPESNRILWFVKRQTLLQSKWGLIKNRSFNVIYEITGLRKVGQTFNVAPWVNNTEGINHSHNYQLPWTRNFGWTAERSCHLISRKGEKKIPSHYDGILGAAEESLMLTLVLKKRLEMVQIRHSYYSPDIANRPEEMITWNLRPTILKRHDSPNDDIFNVHSAPFMRSSSVPGCRALYSAGRARRRRPSYACTYGNYTPLCPPLYMQTHTEVRDSRRDWLDLQRRVVLL